MSRLVCLLVAASLAVAQEPAGPETRLKRLESMVEKLSWELDQVRKLSDDALWFQRLSDIAEVDKVT